VSKFTTIDDLLNILTAQRIKLGTGNVAVMLQIESDEIAALTGFDLRDLQSGALAYESKILVLSADGVI